MRRWQIKYSALTNSGRVRVLLLFLLLPALIYAQYDTTAIPDTIAPDIEEDQVAVDNKKYFLEKSHFETSLDSIHPREIPDSLVNAFRNDEAFWYVLADIKKEEEQKKDSYTPLGQRTWFKTLVWLIIIGGFAGFLIWYLSGTNVGLFRKKQKPVSSTEEDEIMPEDIFAIQYQKEIDKAERQGNFRLAVRLYFLKTLRHLADGNIIAYKQDRTNFDYLMQLHPTRYYNDFFRLTRNYEYSWYGQFEVPAETYQLIRNDFNKFETQLT